MIVANLRRRQMNRKEKAAMVEEYIKLFPERSNKWIADDVQVSQVTVSTYRNELEREQAIPVHDKLQRRDGRLTPKYINSETVGHQMKPSVTEGVENSDINLSTAPEQPQLQPHSEPQVEKPLGTKIEVPNEVLEVTTALTELEDDSFGGGFFFLSLQ